MTVNNATNAYDYFDRNREIYTDFTVEFKDFDKIEITFSEEMTEEEQKERLDDIKNILFNAGV